MGVDVALVCPVKRCFCSPKRSWTNILSASSSLFVPMSAVTGEVGVTVVAGVTVEDGGPKVGIAPVASSVETGIAEVGDAVEAGGSEFDCSLEAGGADASSVEAGGSEAGDSVEPGGCSVADGGSEVGCSVGDGGSAVGSSAEVIDAYVMAKKIVTAII